MVADARDHLQRIVRATFLRSPSFESEERFEPALAAELGETLRALRAAFARRFTPDTWTSQLEQLRERYKHVRPPTLAAMNILIHDQNIALDDAKAQANLHGVRITAASVTAARTLLSRIDPPAAAPSAKAATTPTQRLSRRARPTDIPFDAEAEALVRDVVAKIQDQRNVEADRLRNTMRKAIAVLTAAVG